MKTKYLFSDNTYMIVTDAGIVKFDFCKNDHRLQITCDSTITETLTAHLTETDADDFLFLLKKKLKKDVSKLLNLLGT